MFNPRMIILTAALSLLLVDMAFAQPRVVELVKPEAKKPLPRVITTPPKLTAVCDAFARHVASLDLPQTSRATAQRIIAQQNTETITDSLRVLYPPFKAASKSLGDEKLDRAVNQLKPLLAHDDPYLAAYAHYFIAQSHVMQEDYEAARPLLKEVIGPRLSYTLHSGEAAFMLGLCHAKLLDRDFAIATLKEFCVKYPDASERMIVGALHLIEQLSVITEGTLGDVQERMEYSRRRLQLQRTAKRTQNEQKRIIGILDKLIQEAEQREQQCSGGGSGEGAGGGAGGAAGGGAGGAQQSTAPPGPAHTGPVRRTHRGNPEEQWGAMPDKQREQVLNALKARYPERYRALVEQYYRSLQEEKP